MMGLDASTDMVSMLSLNHLCDKLISFFQFTWTCTNNAAKYETLYLGLSKVISMGIRCLIVHGDSELVINQVRDKISAKHNYLKTYRNRAGDLLKSYLLVNMIAIPRKYNQITDVLIIRGVRLNLTFHKRGSYGVKILCKPSIPDNVNFW